MYCNPDSLLPLDDLLQKIFTDRLTSEGRAELLKEAEARGLTYMDLMREIAANHDIQMQDPVRREKHLRQYWEWREMKAAPYGSDPQLAMEKDLDDEEDDL